MKKYNLSSVNINNRDIKSVIKNLKSGWLAYGKKSIELEKLIKKKFGFKNVILSNSCTNGIHASLIANGFKKGDEVLTSPFTFISTINTLFHLGAKITLCDINLDDFNISNNDIKKKQSKNTKFILPTHYGGNPIDINILKSYLKNKKIKIVEDAATALGSRINKKFCGSYKDSVSIFSLYSNKIITSAEGGIIATDNNMLAKRIKNLISMGITREAWSRANEKNSWEYDLKVPGFKYNFTDLQSALVINQVRRIDKLIKKREILRQSYIKNLSLVLNEKLIYIQKIKKNTKTSNYIFPILINIQKLKIDRNEFIKKLKEKNIFTSVHYIPCHKFSFYKKLFKKEKLPNTNFVYDRIVSLPFHNNLNVSDIKKISSIITKIILDNAL